MAIDTGEIAGVIRRELEKYQGRLQTEHVGYVLQVGDGIAHVYGLDSAMYGELVRFPGGVIGMVLNLERDAVGCIVFGDAAAVREGDQVSATGRVMEVPVGEQLLGRVVSALGEGLDGGPAVSVERTRPIEVIAPGVLERQQVKEPLQTGLKAIDSMIPIGRGQRELIIGDRQIGKSEILIDTIINQKDDPRRPVCIYVAIGQKLSSVAQVVQTLREAGAMPYTIVVCATASDPAPLQFVVPYAGCAMGEEFLWQGRDVLVAYDDLTRHAQAYRQLSLLLRRPPGREAYPGDVFYLHSRLLERACKLSDSNGGGSLTALPIIETQAGDISAYIPTNVISITDGQIYLERDLFHAGVRPAVNVGLSVSRVGGSAQVKAMRQVAGRLRLDLAQYAELSAFAQFSSDLDKNTKAQLARGKRLVELLKQDRRVPMPVERQVMALFAGVNGLLDDIPVEQIRAWEAGFLTFMDSSHPEIGAGIRASKALGEGVPAQLEAAVREYAQRKG